MMEQGVILRAPERAELRGPVIFLAGPIQGVEPWQEKAIRLIHGENGLVNIASPRRLSNERPGDFSDPIFAEQADWETWHLERAGSWGCILFWLAKEQEHFCHRAFAQTSRYELGEWVSRSQHYQKANIVVGIEKGFAGERYIRHRLRMGGHIPILDSLEMACQAAIQRINPPVIEL